MKPPAYAYLAAGSLALASGSGFLASQALGIGKQAPTRTVTINVATGPAGPAGPTGPAGPAGPAGTSGGCPAGFDPGELVINHPGGQVTLFTCLKTP